MNQPNASEAAGCLVATVLELSSAPDLQAIADVVKRAASRLVGADGATFVLREGDLCYYADEDAISPLWKGKRFPLDDCVSGWVMRHSRAAVIPDIYADKRVPQDAYRPTFVKSMAMVPIRQLEPLGAIGNYWAVERIPTQSEVSLLQALADSTAVAMESIGIRHLSMTDELTGLLNRRGFFAEAEGRLARSKQEGLRSSLVYADLDGVKKINDERGHSWGDELIRAGASILRTALGDGPAIGRVGGDEFLALCPGEIEADSLNSEIEDLARHVDHGLDSVSMSVGIVTDSDEAGTSLDELIHAADRQMYQLKLTRSFGSRSRER